VFDRKEKKNVKMSLGSAKKTLVYTIVHTVVLGKNLNSGVGDKRHEEKDICI
jgi:hypothetical protein